MVLIRNTYGELSMDTTKLKAFCTVARLQNISKAAEVLAYTQPAISTQIRALENEYGVNLFSRSGNRVELTESGRQLLPRAQQLLDLFEESREIVRTITEEEKRFIRIGASIMPGVYIVPQLVEKFYKSYPEYSVSISITTAAELERMMLNNEIDVGITGRSSTPTESKKFTVEKLFDDPMVLVVGPGHHLSHYEQIEPQQLAGEQLILQQMRTLTRVTVENWLEQQQVTFNHVLEISNTEAIKRMVMCNLGISIMCKSTVQLELQAGLLGAIPLTGFHIKRGVYLFYPDRTILSPATRQFINVVLSEYDINPSDSGRL